ncbi:MAG: phosphate transport system regulatory protein PhoU [Verrucomicrobia bacterium]|nr:phosphate transport system regulatory protein PhoU [Verrucomicrobiota bacterium]
MTNPTLEPQEEKLERIRGYFRGELLTLRETLLRMASLAHKNLSTALESLAERNAKKAKHVIEADLEMDRLEVEIDEMVANFMATQAPMALACRLMLSASKISNDLERIADQAVSIARRSLILLDEPPLKPLLDIPRMGKDVLAMIKGATDAFVEIAPEKCAEIIRMDERVDEINRQLERELTSFMVEDPKTITRALNLMLVARFFERAADHAKNIAELGMRRS